MVEDEDVPFARYSESSYNKPTTFADWRDVSVHSSSGAAGTGKQQQAKKAEQNKNTVDRNSTWYPGLVRKIPSAVGKVV